MKDNCECGAELEEVKQDGMLLYRCVEYPSCDNIYSETELNERSDMPRYFFINGVAHTGKHGQWYKVADVDKRITDLEQQLKSANDLIEANETADNVVVLDQIVRQEERIKELERRNKVLEQMTVTSKWLCDNCRYNNTCIYECCTYKRIAQAESEEE